MANQMKRVVTTRAWSASASLDGIDLPKEGLITQIMLRQSITMSAALTVIQEDGLWRALEAFDIRGEGTRNFLNIVGEQGGRMLASVNMYDHKGANLVSSPPTAATEEVMYMFHPGNHPEDPFDTSVVIPAQDLATLQALITTNANSVVDDALTISSGTFYLTVWQVTGRPKVGSFTPGLMTPLVQMIKWPHDANYGALGKEFDVPTGAYLRRIFLFVQDDTATRPLRANDEVTAVGIKMKPGVQLVDVLWRELCAATSARAGMNGALFQVDDTFTGHMGFPDGFAVLDFRDLATTPQGKQFGLDLRGAQKGDVQLQFTVENYAAGDDTFILYDRVVPWTGP